MGLTSQRQSPESAIDGVDMAVRGGCFRVSQLRSTSGYYPRRHLRIGDSPGNPGNQVGSLGNPVPVEHGTPLAASVAERRDPGDGRGDAAGRAASL